MKKICAIYLRDSRYGSESKEQESKITGALDRIGCERPVSFEDRDGAGDRSAFDKLMAAVKKGEVSVLIVASLDRIDINNSSIAAFINFIVLLSSSGTRFISVADGLDSNSAAADFLEKAVRSLGRSRRIIQGERIHHALTKSKEEGQPVGRPRQANYETIMELRKNGQSIQRIAEELKISRGAVQNCLRGAERNTDT